MSGECLHVIAFGGECVDCGAEVEPPRDAEVWKFKAGTCAGCGRQVKNGLSRGRGVACLRCIWSAWGGAAE